MPLGWYLAQGLYPLGPSSSDDEEGPCELPDGRIVCGPHGLVYCGKCCTDYSEMNDPSTDSEDDEDEDDEDDGSSTNPGNTRVPRDGTEKKRGTGKVFPTRFTPPTGSIRPTELFHSTRYPNGFRYIHRDERRSALILTDGACLNNGQPNPRAGWAFVHGMGLSGEPAIVSNRLENKGPFGDEGVQSSNRAELRAVIAALRFRHWPGEGIRTMTIATDSEYVVEGSTKWARTWVNNGWKTNANADVKNRDLWEMLLGEVEKWDDAGLSIRFWRIPREWNETADAAAKNAASEDTSYEEWVDVKGF
ncbi:ribonuclease H-like protein [Hypoxylon rubiginosum]|uniref:Ribonuclease H-like protein n=1 Tax=Hypoxylon rubiginosum TaxID=110542 RepID=A0ACB9YZ60_9PEZI|nr:ribonuclease H-like protein [Hypoxylon rubiginosum]